MLGICSLVSTSGYEINIIVTNTGNLRNSKMLHLSEGKIKVISPRSFNFFNIRFINYIINIFSTAKVISKLKSKNTYFIIWDYLPDSVLPIIFSRIPRKNIIVDLEEKIQNDQKLVGFLNYLNFF